MKRLLACITTIVLALTLTNITFSEEIELVDELENVEGFLYVDEHKLPQVDSLFPESTELTAEKTIENSSKANDDVTISKKTFPDSTFRAYVAEEFDSNADGILSTSERNAVDEISVDDLGIYSLAGIECFPKLEELSCDNNRLTSLNVKKCTRLTVLSCSNNRLKSLDVRNNPKLRSLYCQHNSLKSLKLGKHKSIENLNCYDNSDLKSIDIAGCGEMKKWVNCIWETYENDGDGKTHYGWYITKETGLMIDRTTKVYNGKKVLYKPGNPKSVAFKNKSITVEAGEYVQLAVTMKPAGVASYCTFSSSDTDVVEVDKNYNYICGYKEGTATITVKTANGKKGKIKVTVKGNVDKWTW